MKMGGDRFGVGEEGIRETNEVRRLFPNIAEAVLFGSRAKGNFRMFYRKEIERTDNV